VPKASKAINMLYCGLSIDTCEYIFHYESAIEIWDYLYYSYGANEKVLDLDNVKQEEIIQINKLKLQSPIDGNDSCERNISKNDNKIIQ